MEEVIRNEAVYLRLNTKENDMLKAIAGNMGMNRPETMRFLIRKAYEEMGLWQEERHIC